MRFLCVGVLLLFGAFCKAQNLASEKAKDVVTVAATELTIVPSLEPGTNELVLAQSLYKEGKIEEALKAFRAIEDNKDFAKVNRRKALWDRCVHIGKTDKAAAYAEVDAASLRLEENEVEKIAARVKVATNLRDYAMVEKCGQDLAPVRKDMSTFFLLVAAVGKKQDERAFSLAKEGLTLAVPNPQYSLFFLNHYLARNRYVTEEPGGLQRYFEFLQRLLISTPDTAPFTAFRTTLKNKISEFK